MTASGVVAKCFKYAPSAFPCTLVSIIGILRSPVSAIEIPSTGSVGETCYALKYCPKE